MKRSVIELMRQYAKENTTCLEILQNPELSPEEKMIIKDYLVTNRKYKLIEEGMWMLFGLGIYGLHMKCNKQ